MRTRDYKTFSSEIDDINRLQDYITEAFVPLIKAPLTDQVLLGPVQIAITPTVVPHKLGRPMQSWFLAGPLADANVWEISRTNKTLTLQASAPITCFLLVF